MIKWIQRERRHPKLLHLAMYTYFERGLCTWFIQTLDPWTRNLASKERTHPQSQPWSSQWERYPCNLLKYIINIALRALTNITPIGGCPCNVNIFMNIQGAQCVDKRWLRYSSYKAHCHRCICANESQHLQMPNDRWLTHISKHHARTLSY